MPTVPFHIDNKFLKDVRKKAIAYARFHFSSWATDDDCEDLVQDALLAMYRNITSGHLTELTCDMTTYVISILKKLAYNEYKKRGKFVSGEFFNDDDEYIDPIEQAIIEEAIKEWIEEGVDVTEEMENAVREIVTNMKEPCKTILWSFYWDEMSLAAIAKDMTDYKSSDSVKTQKSRCLTKVKKMMKETYKILLS